MNCVHPYSLTSGKRVCVYCGEEMFRVDARKLGAKEWCIWNGLFTREEAAAEMKCAAAKYPKLEFRVVESGSLFSALWHQRLKEEIAAMAAVAAVGEKAELNTR